MINRRVAIYTLYILLRDWLYKAYDNLLTPVNIVKLKNLLKYLKDKG